MFADILQSPLLMIGLMLLVAVIIIVTLLRSPVVRASLSGGQPSASPEMNAETQRSTFFEYVNQGNEHLNHYQWDQALACFQAAVDVKPNEPAVHFKIGRIYAQKEDYRHAITAFKNVLTIKPEHVESYFELARIYQILKQTGEAHNTLEKVLSINPDHEESLKLKAKLYEDEGQYLNALPIVQKLVSIGKFANHRKYRMQYAELLLSAGRHEEAINEYISLIEQDSMNKALYESKIAHLYYDLGEFTRAIEYYRRIFYAEDVLAEDVEIKNKMAAALCNEGVRYFKELGDNQSAVQFYKEALKYDEHNPDIYYNLGKVYIVLGQFENARVNLEKSLELSPKDAACAYELALLEDQHGDIDKAILHYRVVLSVDPQNALAAYGLGSLYGVAGELDNAIDYLTKAVQINPTFEDAIYNLGVALERQNQPNKAIQMYRKVLDLNAEHEQARSNLTHLQHSRF